LGRGKSLYPNLPVQMGLYSPINLYGTKGRENKLLYGPFRPGKMVFSSPSFFYYISMNFIKNYFILKLKLNFN